MDYGKEFQKYARQHLGISGMTLHRYQSAGAGYLRHAGGSAATTGGYINPSIIEERQMNVAVFDVFSRLMMDRIVFLGVPVDDDVANIIQAQLLFLDSTDPGKDINLYINSPGGVVYAGLGIYDTMQLISSDVATICTGLAASMAAVLLTAGAKGKRSALPHSRIMIHQPLGGVQGQASDIEIEAREILTIKDEIYGILCEHTGKSMDEITRDADRNFWMRSPEAVAYGLIDRVLTKKAQELKPTR